MTLSQIRALPVRSKTAPWSAGLDKVRRWIIPNVQPSAVPVVRVYWPSEPQYGTNTGESLMTRDAPQAYMHTLMYLVTKEAHYAETAMNIVSTWAITNKAMLGSNAPLVAGWSQSAMAQAVELLRYIYPRYNASNLHLHYLGWLDGVVAPLLRDMPHWSFVNNWHATMAAARLQIAVYRNDRVDFEAMIQYYKTIVVRIIATNGVVNELSRDLMHTQFSIGSLIQIAETAWNQGIDVYSFANHRLKAGVELTAAVLNGERPSTTNAIVLREVKTIPAYWEVVLNRYKNLTQTKRLVKAARPFQFVMCWGGDTLTHAIPL